MNKYSATVLSFNSSISASINESIDNDHSPLIDPHFVVLMQESEVSNAGDFVRFLDSFRPQAILDLRLSPRLDFVEGSRTRTFRTFDRLSVQYIDVFGRLGVFSRQDLYNLECIKEKRLASFIDVTVKDDRPVVCLFDDAAVIERCEQIFKYDILSYIQNRPSTNISRFRSGLLAV